PYTTLFRSPASARRPGRRLRDLSAEFFSLLAAANCSCQCACFLLRRPWCVGLPGTAKQCSSGGPDSARGRPADPCADSSATGPDHRVPAAGGILTASCDLARVRDRFGLRLSAGERREFGDIAIVDDGSVTIVGGRCDNTRLVDVIGLIERIRQLGHGVLGKIPHDVSACIGAGARCPDGEITADARGDAVFGTLEAGQLIELAIGMPDHWYGSPVLGVGTAADPAVVADAQCSSISMRRRQTE